MSDWFPVRGTLAAGLAAAALAGCVHYQPRPIEPAQALDAFSGRTLTDPGLLQYLQANHEAAPAAVWGLRPLTLVAFYYHPDLDVARAELEAAQAGRVTAGERQNPAISPSVGYNSSTPAHTISPWILGFNLDIPLTTAGKRRHRVAQAAGLADAARFNLGSVAWGVRSRVRASLVELDAATRTEGLLTEQESVAAENARMLERRLEAGEISSFEVSQARLALASVRLALRDAVSRRTAARGQLAEALGVPITALEGVPLSFEGLGGSAEIPTAEALREALLNRADVLGALAEYAASQAALQVEIARQYPDIQLGPGYEFDQGDDKWFLAVSLPVPLLNRNRGPIAEAEAVRSASAARFTLVQARAVAQVDQAIAGYRVALEGAATAERMAADLDKQERTAHARFDAGEISRLELGEARLERVTASLAKLDSEVKLEAALGQLEDAMQRSAEPLDWLSVTPPRGKPPATGTGPGER